MLPKFIAIRSDSPMGPYSWLDDRSTVWTPDYYGYQSLQLTGQMQWVMAKHSKGRRIQNLSPMAERILTALRQGPGMMSRREIAEAMQRDAHDDRFKMAMSELIEFGVVRTQLRTTSEDYETFVTVYMPTYPFGTKKKDD